MVYEEIGNLLEVSEEYMIAHCMSADLNTRMGIVTQINRKYGLSQLFREAVPERPVSWPGCIFTRPVFNLITKAKYNDKPTLETLTQALEEMCRIAQEEGIRKIAMPRIGCGLDKLRWEDVLQRIHQVFDEAEEMEILIRVLPEKPKKPRGKAKSEPK